MDAKRPSDDELRAATVRLAEELLGNVDFSVKRGGITVPAVKLINEKSRQHSQEIPAVFRPDEAAASFRPSATSTQ